MPEPRRPGSRLIRLLRAGARRPLADWALLAEAALRLVAIRALFLRFDHEGQARWFGRGCRPAEGDAANAAIRLDPVETGQARQVGWAVARAERLLPFRVLCVPQALVARAMLRRRGIASVMVFGVSAGACVAEARTHAWLVAGPVPVVGFPVAGFRPFAAFTLP